jgi:RNA-directed DNA polymerase
LCAFGLDLRLEGLAHVLGARYTRYADDIVMSGDLHLRTAMPRVQAWVGRIAREEGFALNHRKTRCLTASARQAVCHIVVNQHPNLARSEFDQLKAILHQCVLNGAAAQNRDSKPHWREYLCGRVAWAAQLNPIKAQRLKRLLEQIDWSR